MHPNNPPPLVPGRMNLGLIAGLVFGRSAYYVVLSWCCLSIFVFMVKNRVKKGEKKGGGGCVVFGGGVHRLFSVPPPQIKTLRLKLLSEAAAEGVLVRGSKNRLRMYLTVAIAAAQPLLMYWLTYHLLR